MHIARFTIRGMSFTRNNTTGMPLTQDGALRPHSEAKVDLLREYLRNYLAVTTNTSHINAIHVYDLFCGPGLYGSAEGSPIIILRALKEIYDDRTAAGKIVPSLTCYLADKEPTNIQSVDRATASLGLQSGAAYSVTTQVRTYGQSLQHVLAHASNPSIKQFVFLDPTGYSDIKAKNLEELLDKKAEILLFLPTQQMYRFIANGTPAPLKDFVSDLTNYSTWKPVGSAAALAREIRDMYRSFLGKGVYVSTFLIEKDSSTVFCLYFFTTKLQGYVKWIDAKWSLDGDAGSGYSFRNLPGQNSLVLDLHLQVLEHKLLTFLTPEKRNNCEIFEFAVIQEEFRATHAMQVCKKLLKEGRITKHSLTGGRIPASAFYINDKHYLNNDRKIEVEVV